MLSCRLAVLTAALTLMTALPASAEAQTAAAIKNAMMLPLTPTGLSYATTSRMCPDGSVMTGLRARVGLVVDAVGLRCRPVNSNGTLGAETSVVQWAGGTGGTERIRSCPTGAVAVGQRIGYILRDVGGVIAIGLECRTWDAGTRRPTGTVALLEVVSSAAAALTTVSARCTDPLHAIRGFRAQVGDVVYSLGFNCGTP